MSFTSQLLYSRKRITLPIGHEPCRAHQDTQAFCRTQKSRSLQGIEPQFCSRPSLRLVTIVTELHQLTSQTSARETRNSNVTKKWLMDVPIHYKGINSWGLIKSDDCVLRLMTMLGLNSPRQWWGLIAEILAHRAMVE